MKWQLSLLIGLLALMMGLAACTGIEGVADGITGGGDGAEQVVPTSTPIPTAPVAARPTYVVTRGTVADIFTFTGRWQPRDQMELHFTLAGTMRQVNVQRGDAVTAGDLLADYQIDSLEDQLDSATLQLETAQNSLTSNASSSAENIENMQISLANARLSLESTRNNSNWTNVASARDSWDNAKVSLAIAEQDYREAISHPENTASTVDSAYQALINAQNSVRSAEYNYYSAAQSFRNWEISVEQSENNVLQAEINLQRAIENAATTSDESVRSAQLSIIQIEEDIIQSSLYAPIDGVVLDVYINPGDAVQAYDTVITIGIPEPKEVVATLAITDALRLSVGMIGVCEAMNQPETAVQCAVRSMPTSAQDADQTTRIAASLEAQPDNQLIEVQMPLEIANDVLWLPPSTIRTFQNRTFVVLQTPDGERAVDVTLGLQTDERVEITSGVNEGDIVIAP